MKLTKRFGLLAALAACAGALALAACSTPGGSPTEQTVAVIQNACAIDAGLRPTVTMLLAVPGLAAAKEIAGVEAARAVIDPICANPSGSVQANTVAVLTGATGQIVALVTDLEERKRHVPSVAASGPK